jgi:quercetin dioxygenase-like cupin family protein
MKITNIPFETIDWSGVPQEEHRGETGNSSWKVKKFGEIRVRVVEYSANYRADHWCDKGHIIYCLEGSITTELSDGRVFELHQGMSYHVEDKSYPHRSYSKNGAKLFIVD